MYQRGHIDTAPSKTFIFSDWESPEPVTCDYRMNEKNLPIERNYYTRPKLSKEF